MNRHPREAWGCSEESGNRGAELDGKLKNSLEANPWFKRPHTLTNRKRPKGMREKKLMMDINISALP